jgi:hypothetical protein
MTIFSEEYFAQIMFWVKAGATSSLVYFSPRLAAMGRSRWTEMTHPELELCE